MSISSVSQPLASSNVSVSSARILRQNKLDQLIKEAEFYEKVWKGLNFSCNFLMLTTSSTLMFVPSQMTLGTVASVGSLACAALKMLCERKENELDKEIDAIEEKQFEAAVTAINFIDRLLLSEIVHIKDMEAAFKQIPVENIGTEAEAVAKQRESLAQKQEWHEAIKNAVLTVMKVISALDIDPCKLPQNLALGLAGILTDYGISLYADSSKPSESLNVLQVALSMQEYGLGLSQRAPDLSKITSLSDLYDLNLTQKHSSAFDFRDNQAQATNHLSQQLIQTARLLRYINNAKNTIWTMNLALDEKLLTAAEQCLKTARNDPKFDSKEIDDQLAELKSEGMVYLLDIQALGHPKDGAQHIAKLEALWDECVALSKNPQKMRARCHHQRTFLKHLRMSPTETIEWRQKALDELLSLPKSQQEINLIAIYWNDLAQAYKEAQNYPEALRCVRKANEAAIQCRMKGIAGAQIEAISANCLEISNLLLQKISDDIGAQTIVAKALA